MKLLLGSSSRCHPYSYLDHLEAEARDLFGDAKRVLFVPFARPGGISHADYTQTARGRLEQMGYSVDGLEDSAAAPEMVESAEAVFIGGGNTFVLLDTLYRTGCLAILRNRIESGMPYMGTSAGSNIAGLSIGTSNDMPIVYPPSFEALGVVPFNLNPHYPALPPDPDHKGETRDERIGEFHCFNSQPVLALHEDGILRVRGSDLTLVGQRHAILFRPGQVPTNMNPGPVTI